MTVYTLAISKRNAAYAYFGMAVRSAFALGLHREETMVIYSAHDKKVRRSVWRSLFVFDRFLAASMGRPTAISEDDCSGDALKPSDGPPLHRSADDAIGELGLDASVGSCVVIGTVLKRVYQRRRISTKLAQEIADACKLWPRSLPPSLHWHQASSTDPGRGIAILHVNLLYYHSVILLTRPFFLFLLNAEVQRPSDGPARRSARTGSKMDRFSKACVIASSHSIVLVQKASEGGFLQRRNPVVIYFLWAAAVIVLSNEFANLCASSGANTAIANSIAIMSHCAESDPQAQRLLYILTTFRDVVVSRRDRHPARLASHGLDAMSPLVNPSSASTDATVPATSQPSAVTSTPSESRADSLPSDVNLLSNSLLAGSEVSSVPDEAIDFDALWPWPAATSSSHAPGGVTHCVQGISDSAVPLFGMAAPD